MDLSPTGTDQKQEFCSLHFLLPLPQDVWIVVLSKNKILFSPFLSLLSPTALEKETQTSSRQPTTGGCYLLVTSPIYGLFCYPITTEAMFEGASKKKKNYFYLPDLHLFVTTHKSSAARKRSLQTLLPLFKPNLLLVLGMASPHYPSDNPHQIKFGSDSKKFLIDSGASVHIVEI